MLYSATTLYTYWLVHHVLAKRGPEAESVAHTAHPIPACIQATMSACDAATASLESPQYGVSGKLSLRTYGSS